MSTTSEQLEYVLEQCGGLGRFQWIVIAITIGSKISVTWSMLMMTFGGAVPDWWCNMHNKTYSKSGNQSINVIRTCTPHSNSSSQFCQSRLFSSEMRTVVSEWDLVCDKESITATITTIQMGGLLFSGLLSGQLADTIGRKPSFFLSLVGLIICNVISAFSISWEMFAVVRFFIGVFCGCYLTVFYTFVIEFTPTKYRPMIMAIPMWPIYAAAYGLMAWWLRDWKHLAFATAIGTAPFLLGVFAIPESYRWLVSNDKMKKAEKVIGTIAKVNGRKAPDVDKLLAEIKKEIEVSKQHRYTVVDLFRNTHIIKRTLLMSVVWVSCGYCYYAISFGVESLSGSLYLNMFLLSLVEIPAQVITWFLNNRIGRRYTCLLFLAIAAGGATAVGTIQMIDTPLKPRLINGFAMTSKLGVAAAWASYQLFTSESFPTVIRNLGYGFANSASRVGAMIAPQIVLLDKHSPGLMYLLCGGVMILSVICTLLLQETKGKALPDFMPDKKCRTDIYAISDLKTDIPEPQIKETVHVFQSVSDIRDADHQ